MCWEGTPVPSPEPGALRPLSCRAPGMCSSRPSSASHHRRPHSARCHAGAASTVPAPPSEPRPSARRPSFCRPSSASAGTGRERLRLDLGQRLFPAELGLSSGRVLTLPSHLDNCSAGDKCCWRWLTHAVLREAAWLKADLEGARELHALEMSAPSKVYSKHDAEAFAELRGAHAEAQRELRELRAETRDLEQELSQLKTEHAQGLAKEESVKSQIENSKGVRDAAATRAAEAADQAAAAELEVQRAKEEEAALQRNVLKAEDWKAQAEAAHRRLLAEYEELKIAAHEALQKAEVKKFNAHRRHRRGGKSFSPNRAKHW